MTRWAVVVGLLAVAAPIVMASNDPRGLRNKNPGNIRYSSANNWQGQIGQSGGFVVFDNMENGVRAMAKLLKNYHSKGFTSIAAIINKYAPSIENPTADYIATVSRRVGVPPNKHLNKDQFNALLPAIIDAMTRVELGRPISMAAINIGVSAA